MVRGVGSSAWAVLLAASQLPATVVSTPPSPMPTALRGSYGRVGFSSRSLTNTAEGVFSVNGADLNGDGSPDILLTQRDDNIVSWYENSGSDTFQNIQTIGSGITVRGPSDAIAVDMDGDGDLDVVVAATYLNDVIWYQNNHGIGTSWTRYVVDSNLAGVGSVRAADVDNDGDMDLIASGTIADGLFWYRNNGAQVFTKVAIATGSIVDSIGEIQVRLHRHAGIA